MDKAKILFEIYPPLPIPKVKREEEIRLITGKPQFSNKAFVVRMPGGRVEGKRPSFHRIINFSGMCAPRGMCVVAPGAFIFARKELRR